jgi:alkaline phosphatase
VHDVEDGHSGYRGDGVDLLAEWDAGCVARNLSRRYLTSGQELREMEDFSVDRLLGLFSSTHLEYSLEQTAEMDDPSLEDMTRAALAVLGTKSNGYVVFIEAGLIDHGHHGNKAREALDETLQLDRAVAAALELVDLAETLVVVTADHSHAMTINGYPDRGDDIFGYGGHGHDGLYYPTLMYGTGPGYKEPDADGGRHDISQDDMTAAEYRFVAAVPETSSDHSGEDVAIYAAGPQAHLFRGLQQQSYIPHVLAYAACIGQGLSFCD